MNKLFMALIIALLVVTPLMAAETAETLTFGWEMADTTNLKEWKIFWGDISGVYDKETPVAVIAYDPNVPGPTFTNATPTRVQGQQGTHVIKYFVMVACGDIPKPIGGTEYVCSGYSNEVSHDFWIPAGQFSVPLTFQIISE